MGVSFYYICYSIFIRTLLLSNAFADLKISYSFLDFITFFTHTLLLTQSAATAAQVFSLYQRNQNQGQGTRRLRLRLGKTFNHKNAISVLYVIQQSGRALERFVPVLRCANGNSRTTNKRSGGKTGPKTCETLIESAREKCWAGRQADRQGVKN